MIWLAVAAGGAIGSLARHGVNHVFGHLLLRPVPYATAVVNVAGSLVIGVLAGAIASGRLVMSQPLRAFVFVGLLGGFTTFSSFMLDTLTAVHGGDRPIAIGNVIAQTVLGFLCVYVGYRLAAQR